MPNQIDQIQQAEKEAENIINSAHDEVKQKTAEVKFHGESALTDTSSRLRKELADIDKKAGAAIESARAKIEAEAASEIATLEKVNTADTTKAIDLIIKEILK